MAPAPVVAARFCTPHATAFTLTEAAISWPWRNFTVTKSGAAAAVMRVEAFRGLFDCHRRSLFLDPRRGSPLLTLVSRRSLFGRRRWEAFRAGDATDADELLFTADARAWMSTPFPMGNVNVFLAASAARRIPDFQVSRRGLFSDRGYTVVDSSGGAGAVAEIDRTSWPFAWFQTYDVRVKAGVDHAFVLALAVIVEELRPVGTTSD
ncbi:uncharacterized protein LOC106866297 [Brachypodium distachyon]|uniref:uncharacterized protein LOC106866297 n=1 Tax=Brachypodium distachyon TaxID=15368 RepID=UPI00071DC8DC|nr:uncharacterized protein LOC106866297 [Brachypodium distachyon]|eukprot:XP_014755504.1 uncharacterized protein LOC106866297 [Brachypodium distachyon]